MISVPHRCVFVKVPKTAGTSISQALQCSHVGKPHRDLREIREALLAMPDGASFYSNAFKFGFVRNPWDRVVSLFLRKERGRADAPRDFAEFCDWIQRSSDTCVHPTPKVNQRDWLIDESGEVAVDFVARFERLDADFATICDAIGAGRIRLPHKKKNTSGDRKHYTEYYTPQLRDTIGEKFAVDIEAFGYTFGD